MATDAESTTLTTTATTTTTTTSTLTTIATTINTSSKNTATTVTTTTIAVTSLNQCNFINPEFIFLFFVISIAFKSAKSLRQKIKETIKLRVILVNQL
jgi:hypothetical protein